MRTRIVSLLLALLLAGMFTGTALAAGEQTFDPAAQPEEESVHMQSVDDAQELEEVVEDVMLAFFDLSEESIRPMANGYVERHASDEIVSFIKYHEGFVSKPMWDVAQWSIGYGSRCPDDKLDEYRENGITEAEATQLLMRYVQQNFEPAINNVAKRNNIALTQNQFDALLDFSYHLGTAWTTGCRLIDAMCSGLHHSTWSTQNSTANSGWTFINAVGTWCNVSGSPHPGAATRRILDLEIFVHGKYYMDYSSGLKGTPQEHYTYLFFDANGGQCALGANYPSGWSTTNCYYFVGSPYQNLLTATRAGYVFDGWYTAREGGTKITESTIASTQNAQKYFAGMTVYAHWRTGSDAAVKPNESYTSGYSDVPDSAWYASAIAQATEKGWLKGFTDGTFQPNGVVTRGMFITILYRVAGEPEAPADTSGFIDVLPGQYYRDAVAWAMQQGVTTGIDGSRFGPNVPITREQAAAFLYRYAGKETDAKVLEAFPDADEVSTYAEPALAWAVKEGVITGIGNDTTGQATLSPQKGATRAQSAQLFLNYKK